MLLPFEQDSHEIPQDDPGNYNFPSDFDLATVEQKIADHVLIRVWRYLVGKPEMDEIRQKILNDLISFDFKFEVMIKNELLWATASMRSLSSTRLNYLDQYAAKKAEVAKPNPPTPEQILLLFGKSRGVN